jgi:[acyl-carrier-protein] S-malonyltransferase
MAKLAIIFPGQGSQYVGMGQALYEADSSARELFAQAESVTGLPLCRLCFEGPLEELTQTVNLQPAITMVNLALYNRLQRHGVAPDFVAGHSLGEYCALYAAGVLSEAETLQAVQKRGQLMEREALLHPGAMAAIIGLSRERLDELLAGLQAAGPLALANYNTPEQLVISGETGLIEQAMAAAKNAGARVVPLVVSGAWHSPLMNQAQPDFSAFLQGLNFRSPTGNILFNVTGASETDAVRIRALMSRQLTSPVLWTTIVEKILASGVDTWVEVGPKNVLKGLVRKIIPKGQPYKFYNVEDPASLENFLSEFKS